jgi:hypothetical protein
MNTHNEMAHQSLEGGERCGEDAGKYRTMTLVQANEQWLNATPIEWHSSRIRNVAQLSPGYSDGSPTPDELCTVVPMELLSEDGKIDVSSLQVFEDITGGLTPFEAGDVLFAKITPCMEKALMWRIFRRGMRTAVRNSMSSALVAPSTPSFSTTTLITLSSALTPLRICRGQQGRSAFHHVS